MPPADPRRPHAFALDIRMGLIQSLRLAHALMETSCDVHVAETDAPKFAQLKSTFGVEFSVGTDGVPVLPQVEVVHEEPRTIVGRLSAPLVFPHAIVDRCRSFWAPRDVPVTFIGLVTPERQEVLGSWVRATTGSVVEIPLTRRGGTGFADRARRRLGRRRARSVDALTAHGIHLWSSERGRTFPVKAWDEEYFTRLGRAANVICPNGDFVWSYRFFESVLCGAMPIVQEPCAAYEGFEYRTMAQPLTDHGWDREVAEHNFHVARDRLTFAIPDLETTVDELLRSQA